MSQQPTTCRIVHYRLAAQDVDRIERGRGDPSVHLLVGNPVQVGDVVPLIIARVWPDEYGPGIPGVNGQALLDGCDSLWVTSAREGAGPGEWAWPPRDASAPTAPQPYVPPAEMVKEAEQAIAAAPLADMVAAEHAYLRYGSVTGGRSAVTGAQLPPFSECKPLVQAGWLAVIRG